MLICLAIKNLTVTELFIRGRKLNISLVLITQSYFAVSNKRELQQIAFNHSLDIDFQGFLNLYKKCTAKPFLLVINTTLAPSNSSHFTKNLLEKI